MKKILVILLILGFGVSVFIGCAPKKPEEPTFKVGLVTDVGGRGDKSFNDSALRGLEEWAAGLRYDEAKKAYVSMTDAEYQKSISEDLKDFGIKKFSVKPVVLESKAKEDYVHNLTVLAEDEKCDLVIGVGFMLADSIKEVAKTHPNTKFMLIDSPIMDENWNPITLPNVISYLFKEEEGSYLVGAIAALVTKKTTLGFVGGMELPIIKKFEAGYKAGVMTINKNIKILSNYTGDFVSADKGKLAADAQFNQGTDIVYHASGACGLGVIKAAEERGAGFYAIGVDSDQDYLAPGRVLTSMIKHVDLATYLAVKSVVENNFKPGIIILGLKEGGVNHSPMTYTKDVLTSAQWAKVNKLKELIINGTIVVPATLEDLGKFVPPTDF